MKANGTMLAVQPTQATRASSPEFPRVPPGSHELPQSPQAPPCSPATANVNQNRVPCLGWLSTPIRPPWASTRYLAMARPRLHAQPGDCRSCHPAKTR